MLKKILLALFMTPFIVIILTIAATMVALNWPTTVINPTTLSIAARHLAPFGIKIDWKEASTGSVSHGSFDETFTIGFDNLCVEVDPTLEKACFDKLDASIRYRFRAIIPTLVALGPVRIEGGDIAIRSTDDKKKKEKHEGALPIPEIKLPKLMAKADIFPIDISIKSLTVAGEEPVMNGRLEAHLKTGDSGRIEEVEASGNIGLPKGESIGLNARASSESNFVNGDWALEASSEANLASSGSATLRAALDCADGKEIGYDIELGYSRDKLRVNGTLRGKLGEEYLNSELSASLTGIAEAIPSIGLAECSLDFKSTNRRKNHGKLAFICPVDIKLKEFDLPRDIDPIYRQPRNMIVDLSVDADAFFFPDMDHETRAKIVARLRSQKSRLVSTNGSVRIDYDGVPSAPPNSWKIDSDADLDFKIDKFGKLVKVLEKSPWPVPAPLNVLEGWLSFSLEGRVSTQTGEAIIPIKLTTKLKSKEQKIFIDSDGKAIVHLVKGSVGDIDFELDVDLDDVQLQLPNIAFAAIPSFTPDGRIVLEPKKEEEKEEKKPTPIDYKLKVKTPKERPVRILSNLTPTHIPIAVDVDIADKDMSGTVTIKEFPVMLFTRKATIEYLKLKLQEPFDKSEISGKLSVPYIDIKIIIQLAGTVEMPVFVLDSKPPMTQGDIISYLLYGEPLDTLDSDNASSVSDMNAAMSDKALALGSFFFLASTPIQSVGYNAETKTFVARIRLGKDMSLKLGSSEREKEVGVRRRLGKGFSITTSFEKYDDDPGGAAAYIEWSKRY